VEPIPNDPNPTSTWEWSSGVARSLNNLLTSGGGGGHNTNNPHSPSPQCSEQQVHQSPPRSQKRGSGSGSGYTALQLVNHGNGSSLGGFGGFSAAAGSSAESPIVMGLDAGGAAGTSSPSRQYGRNGQQLQQYQQLHQPNSPGGVRIGRQNSNGDASVSISTIAGAGRALRDASPPAAMFSGSHRANSIDNVAAVGGSNPYEGADINVHGGKGRDSRSGHVGAVNASSSSDDTTEDAFMSRCFPSFRLLRWLSGRSGRHAKISNKQPQPVVTIQQRPKSKHKGVTVVLAIGNVSA
jgi:hypothetical protein